MTTRKDDTCPTCSPTEKYAVFTLEHEFENGKWFYQWECTNCGHTKKYHTRGPQTVFTTRDKIIERLQNELGDTYTTEVEDSHDGSKRVVAKSSNWFDHMMIAYVGKQGSLEVNVFRIHGKDIKATGKRDGFISWHVYGSYREER